MDYFEKRLEELKQKTDEKAVRREEAEYWREDDLNRLCNRLNVEKIPVFKSGNYAVITLPVGYLVINSFVVDSPIEIRQLETQFELNSYCGYALPLQNNTHSVEDEVRKIKNVLDELAKYTVDDNIVQEVVDWTWFYQLREEGE